jgi:hypothetical protein
MVVVLGGQTDACAGRGGHHQGTRLRSKDAALYA